MVSESTMTAAQVLPMVEYSLEIALANNFRRKDNRREDRDLVA